MADLIVGYKNGVPTQAGASPSQPTGLVATGTIRGVIFTWDLEKTVQPYEYRYRTQVEAQGWSSWKRTVIPVVLRPLTTAEIDAIEGVLASPEDANIQIEVKSTTTDGLTESATTSGNADCISPQLWSEDIVALAVKLSDLASEVTDKMFSSTDRDGADLKAASIAVAKLTSGVTDLMFPAATRIANDTTLVNGVAAATVSSGAADGALAEATLTAKEANWDNAFTNYLNQAAVDARVDVVHPNANYLNSNTTNANVGLTNVEDKSSATIRSEIVDGDLVATTAILEGAWAAFIQAVGQNDSILTDAILTLVSAKLIDTKAGGNPLFDASGNLIFNGALGIKSGATIRTPAAIIASMDASGNSQLIDPASWKVGTDTADILAGNIDATAQFVTANEKSGAGYAFTGLDSSGYAKVGVANGAAYAVSENVEKFLNGARTLWVASNSNAAGGAAIPGLAITGTGAALVVHQLHTVWNEGDKVLRFKCRANSNNDNDGQFRIVVYAADGVTTRVTGSWEIVNSGVYDDFTAEATIPGSVVDGDLLIIDIEAMDDAGHTLNMNGGVLYGMYA